MESRSFRVFRCLHVRLMGVVYLAAFGSLWVQVDGLIGSRGILPAADYFQAAAAQLGAGRFWLLPSLCWISAGDTMLSLLCAGGCAAGLLLALGLLPAPSLAAAWILYLSLVSAGQTFLRFQWDALLLEAGLLSVFLAPLGARCRLPCAAEVPRLPLLLMKLLAFRLMFCSGIVKLTSGDTTWRDLSALTYHYMTQPLPPWTAWYAHQLPAWVHSVSTILMYGIELGAPFCLFGPARLRRAAGAALLALQGVIALTGNYGFFNLLSAVICLVALDDAVWPRRWRPTAGAPAATTPVRPGRAVARWIGRLAAGAAMVAGAVHVIDAIAPSVRWPIPLSRALAAAAPFHAVNGYGLFRVMTTRRPEITLEASVDGRRWETWTFRWKPGDPARRPAFAGPHMPRLDWQMWFAALGDCRSNPWLWRLMSRLREDSPPVRSLLESGPAGAPARYIRAVVSDYRFSRPGEAGWWIHGERRLYCPVLSESGWVSAAPGDMGYPR